MVTSKDIFNEKSGLVDRLRQLAPGALSDVALEITRGVLAETENLHCNYPYRTEGRKLALEGSVGSFEAGNIRQAIEVYLNEAEIDDACTEEAKYLLQRLDFVADPSAEHLLSLLQTGFTVLDRRIWEEVVPESDQPRVIDGKEYQEWFDTTDADPRLSLFLERISHHLGEHLV
ncbi:MAG: hypothetical protein KIS92_02160 [Planctomycetota bacterium]|nr:hypothetical protein [Planctomycetota bacterium]